MKSSEKISEQRRGVPVQAAAGGDRAVRDGRGPGDHPVKPAPGPRLRPGRMPNGDPPALMLWGSEEE